MIKLKPIEIESGISHKYLGRKNQFRLRQGESLLHLIKDEWSSKAQMKERMQQIRLTSLAADDVRVQLVAVQMRVPQERRITGQKQKDLLNQQFQLLCTQTSGKRKDIYPFSSKFDPAMMCFLVVVRKNGDKPGRAERFAQELQQTIINGKLESRICIGETVKGLNNLKNGFASCLLAWNYQDKLAIDKDIQEMFSACYPPAVERQLVKAIEWMETHTVREQLELILSVDKSVRSLNLLAIRILLLLSCIAQKYESHSSSLQRYIWNSLWTLSDYTTREAILIRVENLVHLVMEEVKRTRSSGIQSIIEAVRKYVELNFTSNLTPSSLAIMFHLSESCLSEQFKRYVGITISQYVTRLRITQAELLLRENELKLNQIAVYVGYSNIDCFTALFKKYCGLKPREYRELYGGRSLT